MSFLTAQEAVQTCVLSKRWKNLWTTLPVLDFDLVKFKYDSESQDSVKVDVFVDFVNATLLLRKASDLHNLRLSGYAVSHFGVIRSWILYALKHNLQVLNIYHTLGESIPTRVFNCASLVDASFGCSFKSVRKIKVINLPRLRRLSLRGAHINQDFVDKLFCGCPVLEFLNLEHCLREFSTINSQSLKYLSALNCLCTEQNRMEMINTPNLLSYSDSICALSGQNLLLKMPSLTSASIDLNCCRFNCPSQNKSNILMGLSNVQNLKLSGFRIKDFLETEVSHPEFLNAKDLPVDDLCLSCHFNKLASFLNHFPNLEKISLYYGGCSCKVRMRTKKSLKVPFKGEKLKTVEILQKR